MKEKWFDSIKDRMDSYEESVPDGLWDAIETSVLGKEKPARRAVVMPWIWSVAAAAAVAFGVFIGVRLADNDKTENIRTAENQENRVSNPTNPSSSVDIAGGPAPSASPVDVIPREHRDLVAVAMETVEKTEPAEPAQEPTVQEAVSVQVPEQKPEQAPEVYKGPEGKPLDVLDMEDWPEMDDGSARRRSRQRPISVGLSFAGSSANSDDVSIVESKSFFQGSSASAVAYDEESVLTRAVSEPVKKEEKHNRPIRASLSLSYPLNDRFAIESGLTYSLLHSKFSTTSGETVSEDVQTLGYLGIPLNLRANIISKDNLSFYALGGGIVEKCLQASSKTTTMVSGRQTGSDVRRLSVEPLMWSLNASAGLQFSATDRLGLYVEPGLSYHFDNNSKVRSVYTEHPLDFVLTFGARISFR